MPNESASRLPNNGMVRPYPAWLIRLAAAVVLLVGSVRAQGAYLYWNVSSGNWLTASNWGGTLPKTYDGTYIVNGGTATVMSMGAVCDGLTLGSTAGSGTIQMTGGSLSANTCETIGGSGTGTFTQSGGTNRAGSYLYLGSSAGINGTYNLSGTGQLSTGYAYIGNSGTGKFVQSGGTNATSLLYLGYRSGGAYNLSGTGQLTVDDEYAGYSGTGDFTQTGGTHSVSRLYLGYGNNGSYSLSGTGQLSAGSETIGEYTSGSFTQSGGTNTISNYLVIGDSSHSNGVYNLSSGQLLATYAGELVARDGVGNLTQTGGINTVVGFLAVGYNSGSNGTYSLSGTGQLSAKNEYVAYYKGAAGRFQQPSGTNTVTGLLAVGYEPGSNGTYSLSGTGQLSATNEYVAYYAGATGLFQQSGGTNSVGCLTIGTGGRYQLTGGTLQVNANLTNQGIFDGGNSPATLSVLGGAIADFSTGTFQNVGQTSVSIGGNSLLIVPAQFDPLVFGSYHNAGMTHTAGTTLAVPAGQGFGGQGSIGDLVDCQGTITASGGVNLNNGLILSETGTVALGSGNLTVNDTVSGISSGSLSASNHYIGKGGTGVFTQSGGSNTIGYLGLACNLGDSGTYNQTGGKNTATSIGIGNGGRYQLNGGTLQINEGIINQGVFEGGSRSATLIANCLVDLTTGTWSNLGAMSVSMGSNSLLIVPSGFDTAAGFASYHSLGLTHTMGTTLTVPAGQGFSGPGSISDLVNCQGTITDAVGINLNNGLVLSGSGTVALGNGNLTVNDIVSGISGGSLSGSYHFIAKGGTGAFTQSGGTNTVLRGLYLGYNVTDSGTYALCGTGKLSAPTEYIGFSGSGTFTQTGGSNVTSLLQLGSSSAGTYNLSGEGHLTVSHEYVGYSGTGSFMQSGGTNTVSNDFFLGYNSGSNGTYSLSGRGQLSVSGPGYEYLGYSGTASVTQTGGTNTVSNSLRLGENSGSIGTYYLSGTGQLFSEYEEVVGQSGTGIFTQSGGTNTVTESLRLGENSGSSGTYNLSGSGQLFSYYETIVGHSGIGVFTQSGGTNTSSPLLGYQSGSNGTYNLNGGTLIVLSITKGSGTASFNFNGGTLQAGGTFSTALPVGLNTGGGNATIDSDSYTVTLSGLLSGPGNLIKTGSGTLILSAANTYTGSTTVNAGILSITGSLSSNALTVGGGTFSYAPTAKGGIGNSQAMAGLTVNVGASTITASAGNTLALGAIVRNAAGVVDFNSNTTGTITTTRANTNGTLGPWATYGSGASMKYALASGSGTPYIIAPYNGATAITSGVTGLTDTSGTVNYSLTGGGGTLAVALVANTLQFAGAANTITSSSANFLSLNGLMNVGSGTATIAGGKLIVGSTKELVCTGPGNVNIGADIQDNASGPSTLIMAGGGKLVLSGTNLHTGGTILSSGTLNLNNAAALSTGALTVRGGTFDNTSGAAMALSNNNPQNWSNSFTFAGSQNLNLGTGAVTLEANASVSVTANTLAVDGIVSGPYRLTKTGSGTLVLSGPNVYAGGTVLTAGTLAINNASALGTGPWTINGGTIDNTSGAAVTLEDGNTQAWNGNFAFAGTQDLDLGDGLVSFGGHRKVTVIANTLTVGGSIASNYSLTKDGNGTLTLAGTNTYVGGMTLSAGRLNINSTTALGSGTFTISGVSTIANTSEAPITLLYNNPQAWNGDFTFVGTRDLDLGTGGVTLSSNRQVTANAGTLTVGGPISGNYSLTKNGTGTLILNGSSVYTGPTTVSEGKLAVNGSLASISAVTVKNGGTLGGNGTVGGVTVNSGGHLAPGNSIGMLTLTGNLSLLSGAKMDFELDTPTASDEITMSSSTLTLDGQQFADFIFMPKTGFGPGDYVLIDAGTIQGSLGTNGSGTIDGMIGDLPATISTIGNDVVLHVVPEPSTMAVVGVGAIALLVFCWQRRRAA